MDELTKGEKIVGAMSYIIFFLFFINGNKKEFNRFHANQGFLFFLTIIASNIFNNYLFPYLPTALNWIASVAVLLFIIYLFIKGISNASKGETKELPLIGRFKILNSKTGKEL